MLYPNTITARRRSTTGVDATGFAIQSTGTVLFSAIAASVQANRTGTGASEGGRRADGTLDQPVTVRIYTPVDVSSLLLGDIVVHDQTGESFKVIRVIDQAGQGRSWRIEASTL